MAGVGTISVGIAVALVILTSALYRNGLEQSGVTERVRLLMELESYALQRAQEDGTSDAQPAIDILDRLRPTAGPDTRHDVERLRAMILSLATATTVDRGSRLDALIRELRRVVASEGEDARRTMADAASWNRVANIVGIVAVIVLVTGVAGALGWLWRSALQPLVTVIEAIGRFARGDTNVRAPDTGPSEIREVAAAFNDMATTLARHREEQLAFIGGVAHDLRNPLNALQVAIAVMDQPASDPVRIRDRVRRQIERLDQMIGDLLDRTRIETGQFELHPELCDLRDVLARVVDAQRDSVPGRSFRLLMPHEPVSARCDGPRMEQVLNNLLGNAAKYSPESSDVEVVLECADANAVVSVTDHGIGIAPSDRSKIFEPFRRGKNVGNIGGSGLGLSVARKIVAAHGGTIDVRSDPGSGSVFTVRLPLVSHAEMKSDHVARTAGSDLFVVRN
jgi:signal transduction histidine kinase